MPKISGRVTTSKASTLTRLRNASNDGLTFMGQQALKDTTQYVPRDQGILQDSGITNSDSVAVNMEFSLRWSTPYARYLWNGDVMYGNPTERHYGPEKLSFTSALAREEWAKYAYKVHGDAWKKVYQNAVRRLSQK